MVKISDDNTDKGKIEDKVLKTIKDEKDNRKTLVDKMNDIIDQNKEDIKRHLLKAQNLIKENWDQKTYSKKTLAAIETALNILEEL